MTSIETLIALRDSSIKQTKELDEMIKQMTKKITINYDNNQKERVETCYASRYPAEIILAHKYNVEEFYVLCAILGDKYQRYTNFINDPTNKDGYMQAHILKSIKVLCQVTTCSFEKKRLLAIAKVAHERFGVLLSIYNDHDNQYVLSDTDLNDLFIFMKPSTAPKELNESIMSTITVIQWNRKYGICDSNATKLLFKFVREWIDTDTNEIFISIE